MNSTEVFLHTMRKLIGSEQPSMANLVLKHGRDFADFAQHPAEIRRGRMQECFKNATHLAFSFPSRFTYCEGYADGCIPVHHAWVIDEAGSVIETTWEKHGLSYYGIPFQVGFLMEQLRLTETYGLLDNPGHWQLVRGDIDPAQWLHPKFCNGRSAPKTANVPVPCRDGSRSNAGRECTSRPLH